MLKHTISSIKSESPQGRKVKCVEIDNHESNRYSEKYNIFVLQDMNKGSFINCVAPKMGGMCIILISK